ncbi:precorrin-2 dehydrogenase/sirohydrochlorin ferrochelatase family protein [Guggenheimella bovis]
MVFPFYVHIDNLHFLILGGGKTAQKKLQTLRSFTENIVLIASETELDEPFVIHRSFEPKDLEGVDIVVCATGKKETDRKIASLCKERGIPVDVTSDPDFGTFIIPSIIHRGDLLVSISTNGSSPLYAKLLRERIEEVLPEHVEEDLSILKAFREKVKAAVTSEVQRRSIFEKSLKRRLEGASLEELIEEFL